MFIVMSHIRALIDLQMLHGKAAFRNVHLILNAEFLRILARNADIGAYVYDLEMVVIQFVPVPIAYLLDNSSRYDRFSEADLVCQKDPPLATAKNLNNTIGCLLLEICKRHLRTFFAASSN